MHSPKSAKIVIGQNVCITITLPLDLHQREAECLAGFDV